MPTYLYKCKNCDSEFEEIHRIAEREKPLNDPCDTCSGEIQLIPQVPSVMYSMRDGFNRHTSEGFKDRMREIKRNHPASNINI
jgi:putative FmdB family regulatory protein